ncbi:MAG TPA: CHAD domain-containing protein [Hyphomicrobiaceae bacterium]|nr:CHAD domain-containing protein [Hyphomicrobiaceae bacterium]
MSLARGRELKLELTHDELQQVRSQPALGSIAAGEPVICRTRSLYFDTPDHRMRSLGFFVRLRSEGDGWLQTIEGADGRNEAIDATPVAVAGPDPDVQAIPDRHVRRTLKKALKHASLAPVFETVVERTTRRLHASGADVQLALEEGFVRAGNAQDSLCGAELALTSGNPEALLQAATRLFADTPVRLPAASAAEKGYGLARGRPGRDGAPHAGSLELRSGQSCAEVFGILVHTAAEQIAASRNLVLESEAPAAAHQLRIGLRRLRSALVAFRPLADSPGLRGLEEQARTLAHSVGALRDADVLIEDICGPVTAAMRVDPGLVRLNEALAAHREEARRRVRLELCSRPWAVLQLKLALCRNGNDDNALAVPIGDFARSAMRRRWRKVAASGARLEHLSIEERHAMRKALKQLRYTAEFFASLYPARATRRFIKEVRALQEVFGYLNDVAAAERLTAICNTACAESPEAQRAAGYILGWHNAQAARAWRHAHAGWKKLEAMPRFWA